MDISPTPSPGTGCSSSTSCPHLRHRYRANLIDFDKPDYRLLDRFDRLGLLSMAGFLGGLEYVLEEGSRNDWFGDHSVLALAWLSGIWAIVFFVRVLLAKAPIVDLRAFEDRNFALGSLHSLVLGIGLYGLTYLYPLYLAEIRGYDACVTRDGVRLRPRHVLDRADRRAPDEQGRSAHAGGGILELCRGSWWMTYLTTFASKPALETLDALRQQLQQLMQITHTQGLVMAFADVFFLLMLLFVALAALAVIIKKTPGVHGA